MLPQTMSFPCAANLPTTIADIRQLRGQQGFDLVAVPIHVIWKQATGGAQAVYDVPCAGGSETTKDAEGAFPATPLTFFLEKNRSTNFLRVTSATSPPLSCVGTATLEMAKSK